VLGQSAPGGVCSLLCLCLAIIGVLSQAANTGSTGASNRPGYFICGFSGFAAYVLL